MDALSKLLTLPAAEKEARGLGYTPREIFQQPATWQRTYQLLKGIAPNVEAYLASAGLNFGNVNHLHVILVGAGTSDYVGRSLSALLQKEWRCAVQTVPSTDLLTNAEDFLLPERTYLWVSFSRSGDSSEGIAALESALAQHPTIRHLVITCNEHGHMARAFQERAKVFGIILDDEVNDRGLAMTSSFSNMIIAGHCLAHLRELKRYGELLDVLTSAARQLLPVAADMCERLVQEGFSKVCFLGTGPLKSVAVESGLKVLELTAGRVVTFAESFLGLRHGPLSAIDNETLVVGFLSGDARRSAFELDLLQEIHAKELTEKYLVIMPEEVEAEARNITKNRILLDFRQEVADFYRPPVDVLVGQLLGLFSSINHGLKPDAPSPQGAISRVVSHVKIY
ncbi:MAG: SIS domain-containing protein [Pyrinomonadaceae bacterium]